MENASSQKSIKPSKAILMGLWIVGIYFIVTSSLSLAGYHGAIGQYPVTPLQWANITYLDIVFVVGVMVISLIGGVLVLLKRRFAFPLLAVSVVTNISILLTKLVATGLAHNITAGTILIQYGLMVAAVGFVFFLYQKNVLWK